jgi:hypothetical protein
MRSRTQLFLFLSVSSAAILALPLFGCSRQPEDKGALLPLQYKIDSLQHVIDSIRDERKVTSRGTNLSESSSVSIVDSSVGTEPALDEAWDKQWRSIRHSSDNLIGRSYNWTGRVDFIPDIDGQVWVNSERGGERVIIMHYEEGNVAANHLPVVRKDDWIHFSGNLKGVSEDGEPIFEATKLKNLGYDFVK